jgi:hypothetical protein
MLALAQKMPAALAAAVLSAGLGACGTTPPPRPEMNPEEVARSVVSVDPLAQALDAYHDDGDIAPLQAWLAEHPEHPDASLWREVVALRSYERAIDRAVDAVPPDQPVRLASADLNAVVLAHPGTLVARTAQAALGESVLVQLRDPVLGRRALDFFEGGDAWACDGDGQRLAPDLDLERFRTRHEATLLQGVERQLRERGCDEAVGWCSWWVERYPDAPGSEAIRADLEEVWYRRGHPPWKSRRHLRCANACARECRPRTTPFDDGCYTTCYAGC